MGFGLDGRLDLDAVARELRGADVVLLSEVDRGWWLNGGHDTLALLAGRLEMPYVFAPAADPVWGDAVLSRFPMRSGQTRRLTARTARRPGRRPSASRSTSAAGNWRWWPRTCNRRPAGIRSSRRVRWPRSPGGTRTAVHWCSAAT
ncbi:hypothetical protein QTS76_01515 [Micromonospora sp. b486]|nr:hypothetical protein [Micromonospora sp. b486]MDM4777950.1 hypothetical protein [Micromonospora sp. b486]